MWCKSDNLADHRRLLLSVSYVELETAGRSFYLRLELDPSERFNGPSLASRFDPIASNNLTMTIPSSETLFGVKTNDANGLGERPLIA